MVAVQLTADQFTEVKDEEAFDPVVGAEPLPFSFRTSLPPSSFLNSLKRWPDLGP